MPHDTVFEVFEDYNFRGSSYQLTSKSNENSVPIFDPWDPNSYNYKFFKSYRFFNTSIPSKKLTFACYNPAPSGFNIIPICLQPGDKVPMLTYPWESSIHNVTVPDSLVAIVYSEHDNKGDCQAYFKDTVFDEKSESKILSIAVEYKSTWKGCSKVSTMMPSVTATTTKSPTTRLEEPNENSFEDETQRNSNTTAIPNRQVQDKTTTSVTPSTEAPTLIYTITQNTNTSAKPANKTAKHTAPSKYVDTTADPEEVDESIIKIPAANILPTSTSPNTTLFVALAMGIVFGVLAVVMILDTRRQRRKLKEAPINLEDYASLDWHDLDLLQLYAGLFPLTHEIASGSTGCLYLGSFQGQQVAIKTLHPNPTCEAVQTFIDEIQLLGTIKCQYIVTLIGVVWTNPTNIQSVMEYMNLGDLRLYLNSTTMDSFPWTDKFQCALCIARGLFYLHSQQTIHRDLKSRNVLLDSTKGTKLADFGSAKGQVYDNETMTAMIGTFRWMAPEMLLFKGYTSAVGVYSFGVMLSEMSTHKLPYCEYEGQGDESIISRVLHENLRPSFGNGCPKWLELLAKRCMSEEPEERPISSQLVYILESNMMDATKTI